jgi:hypothetical protein
MLLHRVTTNPFEGGDISSHNIGQDADAVVAHGSAVIARFDRFGNGARRSDFELTIHWSDVEQLIAEFSEAKHPEAVELQNALQLAKALKEVGWRPPEISN